MTSQGQVGSVYVMHSNIHMHTHRCTRVCTKAHMHIHTLLNTFVYMPVCTFMLISMCLHALRNTCTCMHTALPCMHMHSAWVQGVMGLQILISYPLPTYDSGRNGGGWIMWWWASHWSHPIPTPTRTGLNLLKNKLVCLHSSSSLPSPGTQISTVRIRWMTDLFKINLHLFIRLIFN